MHRYTICVECNQRKEINTNQYHNQKALTARQHREISLKETPLTNLSGGEMELRPY